MTTSVRRRLVSAAMAGGLAMTGTAVMALPAGADAPKHVLTVTPEKVPVAGSITVKGDGCLFDGKPGVAIAALGNAVAHLEDGKKVVGGAMHGDFAEADAEGKWSSTFKLEPALEPGTYPVIAVCYKDKSTMGFQYDDGLTVTVVEKTAEKPTATTTTSTATKSESADKPKAVKASPLFTG